jgi:hypothetical protein
MFAVVIQGKIDIVVQLLVTVSAGVFSVLFIIGECLGCLHVGN